MRDANRTTPSGALKSVTIHPALAKAQSIVVPDDATFSRCGSIRFLLDKQYGVLEIEAGRCDSLFIRGTPYEMISFGVVLPEWIPGQTTTNATSQQVVFESDGPQLPLGKPKGKRSAGLRIIVRAWGATTRTVEVRVPMTVEQQAQCERIYELRQSNSERDESVREAPRKQVYRREGNVIFLGDAVASRFVSGRGASA